jgi:hypothetical protein
MSPPLALFKSGCLREGDYIALSGPMLVRIRTYIEKISHISTVTSIIYGKVHVVKCGIIYDKVNVVKLPGTVLTL